VPGGFTSCAAIGAPCSRHNASATRAALLAITSPPRVVTGPPQTICETFGDRHQPQLRIPRELEPLLQRIDQLGQEEATRQADKADKAALQEAASTGLTAQVSGSVEIQFKSDYFKLDNFATMYARSLRRHHRRRVCRQLQHLRRGHRRDRGRSRGPSKVARASLATSVSLSAILVFPRKTSPFQ